MEQTLQDEFITSLKALMVRYGITIQPDKYGGEWSCFVNEEKNIYVDIQEIKNE